MGKKIKDAKRNKDGKLDVLFEGNTTFTDADRAIDMTENGKVNDAHVVDGKNGKHIRSDPDSNKGNNLSEMADK